MELTQAQLKSLLAYDPETGVFTWVNPTHPRKKHGQVAGSLCKSGYISIGINQHSYPAGRLAWLYMTGAFPLNVIDHINRVRSDNRWVNLRDVTRSQNNYNQGLRSNNTSGYVGVYKLPTTKGDRWRAAATHLGKLKDLGIYDTPQEASEAYTTFVKQHRTIEPATLDHKGYPKIVYRSRIRPDDQNDLIGDI